MVWSSCGKQTWRLYDVCSPGIRPVRQSPCQMYWYQGSSTSPIDAVAMVELSRYFNKACEARGTLLGRSPVSGALDYSYPRSASPGFPSFLHPPSRPRCWTTIDEPLGGTIALADSSPPFAEDPPRSIDVKFDTMK